MPTAVSIKTLIVDDQQTMRSLIRTSLHALGITQTREAPDGEEALRQLIAAPANLVITVGGQVSGKVARMVISASTPPVDDPIARIASEAR